MQGSTPAIPPADRTVKCSDRAVKCSDRAAFSLPGWDDIAEDGLLKGLGEALGDGTCG